MPEYLHHHLKLHRLHFTEINELYSSLSVYAFATGLAGIFVPIYLYNLGYSITVIASFYIVSFLFKIIVYKPTIAIVTHFGPKHALLLSYLLTLCYTILLFWLAKNPWLLYPAASLGGLAHGIFWLSRHIDTATVISDKSPTTQYSNLQIFSLTASSSAPLLGGIIATMYGIAYTLLGSAIGLLVAAYPLFKTLEPIVPTKAKLALFRTAPLKHLVANFAMNSQSIIAILMWPLFIFMIVMSYDAVGLISSASLVLIILITWFIGRMGDRGKNNQLLRLGSNSRSAVHLARGFAGSFPAVLGVNILGDITDTLASVPYAVRFYEGARQYGIASYLLDMEIVGDVAKIVMWSLLAVTSMWLGLQTALIVMFLLAAAFMPFLHLIEPLSLKATENSNM